ncbi:SurA N-terminal domain-containing protein [Streptomyces sp. NRRL S-87]|uniref:SurA N-terminal domain-containing protein n=1 Tax=Streptomyces sp. NRRL S-87 TaxID=1463920 RepID=UPI0004C0E23E|nr:SurA N-terminal domain-containing protein [Streptomyces sp. NRRL S-87]
MHRRTALSVSAALLAAAPLLTACASDTRAGTAAVVGGERIATSALQAQVKDVREAQNRSPQAADLIGNSAGLERAKLNSMIQSLVLEKAAKNAGLTVTTREIEDARAADVQRLGGEEQFEAMVLQQASIAPDQIDAAVRDRLIVGKLGDKYGHEQIIGPVAAAAKQLGVKVNPRYGAWDASKIQLAAVRTPWITQRTAPQEAPRPA